MVVRLVWNWVDRVSPRTFARLEFGRCNMGLRSDIRGPWKEIFFGGGKGAGIGSAYLYGSRSGVPQKILRNS